jgi:hypothetical protein
MFWGWIDRLSDGVDDVRRGVIFGNSKQDKTQDKTGQNDLLNSSDPFVYASARMMHQHLHRDLL